MQVPGQIGGPPPGGRAAAIFAKEKGPRWEAGPPKVLGRNYELHLCEEHAGAVALLLERTGRRVWDAIGNETTPHDDST